MRPHRYTNVAVLGVPFPGATFGSNFTTNQYQLSGAVYGVPSSIPGWTFTRASTGYAETVAGTLTSFASGAPRITDKGLLIEEARTNLLLRSQEFDNASWTKANATVTANATAAPDGTVTADSLIEDASAASQHRIQQAVTVSSGTAYTFSVYAKADTRLAIYMRIIAATTVAGACFNLQAGTINIVGSGTATITALANGWYRCTITGTTDGTTATCYTNLQDTAGGTSIGTYNGDGTSGLYLWGAQLEAGAFATSYIPTTTASATRADDSATISGLTVASLHTLYSEITYGSGTTAQCRHAVLSNGSNERTYLGRAASGIVQGFTTAGGVTPSSSAISGVLTSGTYKTAVSVGATTFICSRSGLLGSAVANSPPSGLSLLTIAGEPTSLLPLNGYVRTTVVYPTAFTDAALQALTT